MKFVCYLGPLLVLALLGMPAFGDTYTGCPPDPLTHQCISDLGADMNIYLGTSELFGPGHVLLSTTTAMTLDLLPGPNIAAQIAADTTMPPYIAAHISNFIGNTDLAELVSLDLPTDTTGLAGLFTDLGLTVNPITVPTAAQNLVTGLTTQSVPFTVTGDTGFTFFGGGVPVYQYFIGAPNSVTPPIFTSSALGPFALNGTTYTFEGITDVNVYIRDIQLTETTTTPEPKSGMLVGTALALLLLIRRKSSSTERT